LNWDVTRVHYDRLEENRKLLGMEQPTDKTVASR
jgi:hypothetical protein